MARSFETKDYVYVARGSNFVKVKKELITRNDVGDLEFSKENFEFIQESLMKLMDVTGDMLDQIRILRSRNEILESSNEALVKAMSQR